LGDNTGINDSTPVQVHGYNNSGFLTGVVAIAAGQQFSLALKKDGSVWAWGSNATGQCGDYTSIQRNTPIQVHGPGNVGFLTGITALAAGGGHALALKNDSTVWSWGFNINGELGDNTQLTDSVPEQVHGTGNVGFLTGITYIKAGDYFSGAIDKNTNVWTWGYNYYGQCGINDTTGEEVNTPVEVHGPGNVGFLSGIVSISLGDEHVLALKNDGSLYTWGWNGNGQLGNDSTVDRWTPINIVSPCNVKLATPTVITGNNEIKFYPNPTNREINVANENHNISAIEIYNMLGEKTYESKVSQGEDIITTNVSFETAGVYLLRVETVGGTIVNKEFVIQK
jgi:alpha-tubulin suppressor-like RCC1 family protein